VVTGGGVVVVEKTTPTETTTPAETTTPTETTKPAETTKPVTPSNTDKTFAGSKAYKVVGLEDGGVTVVLNVDGEKVPVRMIGVAPLDIAGRSYGKNRQTRPPVTTLFLRNLLMGEKVYIIYDAYVDEQDDDDKYIAHIYRAPDGLQVNMEAIRQGFAVADTSYDFEDKETFLHYQSKARKLDKGAWKRIKRKRKAPGKNSDKPRPKAAISMAK